MREKREGRRQNRRSESGGWIRLLLFSLFLRRDLVLRSLQFRLFTTGVVSFFLGADRRRLVVWCIETSPFSGNGVCSSFFRPVSANFDDLIETALYRRRRLFPPRRRPASNLMLDELMVAASESGVCSSFFRPVSANFDDFFEKRSFTAGVVSFLLGADRRRA